MRIAVISIVLAVCATAHADDECRGSDADTEQCSIFWPTRDGRVPASTAIGWANETFDPNGRTFTEHHRGFLDDVGQYAGSNLAPMRGNGFYIDPRYNARPWLYVGLHLGAAFAAAPMATFATRGGQTLMWDHAWWMTMASVVGVRVPFRHLTMRAELVSGIHGATLTSGTLDAASDPIPLVEPRAALDFWLSPWWAVEMVGGVNVLDNKETMVGIGIGWHGQAFDRRYW